MLHYRNMHHINGTSQQTKCPFKSLKLKRHERKHRKNFDGELQHRS